jgi:hypothetical protein
MSRQGFAHVTPVELRCLSRMLTQRTGRTPRTAACAVLVLSLLTGCAEPVPTSPESSQLVGLLNGQPLALPGNATLIRRAGAPDTLVLSGWGLDLAIRVQLEYRGPGAYALGPEHVEVLLLVGGDVRTGGYRGNVAGAGELQVLQAGGAGTPFRASLTFDAYHRDGEQRLGPQVAFRGSLLGSSLQVWRP